MKVTHRPRLCPFIVNCVALLLMVSSARAMPIPTFDKLSPDDRASYITGLAQGAAKALYDRGNVRDGDRLVKLFDDTSKSGGGAQFWKYLAQVREINEKNSTDTTHKTQPYEVEHAFALMLKDNGITVPVSFLLTVNRNFKPTTK